MTPLALMLAALLADVFTVSASARVSSTVELSREAVRGYLDDTGLLERNMPGLTALRILPDGRLLYQTEKDVPLSGPMRNDFLITRSVVGDSVTVLESADPDDPNYMCCRIVIRPLGEQQTAIEITFQVRLTRQKAGEIHWLAPVLGAEFLSDRMASDLEEMLEAFLRRSNEELASRGDRLSGPVTGGAKR